MVTSRMRVILWKNTPVVAAALSSLDVVADATATLVHYSSEHWSSMRCGGTCRECQDVSAGLDACKRYGWIKMIDCAACRRETHYLSLSATSSSANRGATEAIDFEGDSKGSSVQSRIYSVREIRDKS